MDRIRVELEKTLMSQRPEIAGEMIKVGLLSQLVHTVGKTPGGLECIAQLPMEQALRWCAFCVVLLDGGFIASASELLRGLNLDGKTIKTCTNALSISDFPRDHVGIKGLLAKHGVDAVRCAAAAQDAQCLPLVNEVTASGECYCLNNLAITGRDLIALGRAPGCELGRLLEKLLAHVIVHPEDNKREILLELAQSQG
jgi:tRNA nucleotidyltransferase (CCA-adding enzyme)